MGIIKKQDNSSQSFNDILKKLDKYDKFKDLYTVKYMEPLYNIVNNFNTFQLILNKLNANARITNFNAENVLNYVINNLYPKFYNGTPEGLDNFNDMLDIYLNTSSLEINSLDTIYACFSDKALVVELYAYLIKNNIIIYDNSKKEISELCKYLIKAREYFVDDRALFTSFISLCEEINVEVINHESVENIQTYVEKKLGEVKKASGVYDIDQNKLHEMDRKIEALGLKASQLDAIIQTADNLLKKYNIEVDNINDEITKIRIAEIKALEENAKKILSEFNAAYSELLNGQKKDIDKEKERIIEECTAEIEKRKEQLTSMSNIIISKVDTEINKIHSASKSSIKKIDEYISSNDDLKKIISEVKSDEDLLHKINQIKIIQDIPSVSTQNNTTSNNGPSTTINNVTLVEGESSLVVPTAPIYFYDNKVTFKERYKKLVELKEKLIKEKDEIFHEKFDDILIMVLQGDVPYMYGPSGCGKTYMIVNQLAKLLGTEVLINGYIMYEQDILGYTNAGTGGYVPSNFYRCYKFGNIMFLDEIDNGIASATTVLNPFLISKYGSSFVFPNGEVVNQNINFRIITAGNTKGSGKTFAHNTRQKMDESVMQRLTPIEVDYDNRIEKRILKDYPGWYDFGVNFRSAVASLGTQDEKNTIGTFTTRDAETVKRYLDDGAFNDDKLIDYQIIENKDLDYLNQIISKMENIDFETKAGKDLFKKFKNKVRERQSNNENR